jgi:hypothetical protein
MGAGSGPQKAFLVMLAPPMFRAQLRWAAFSDGGIATVDTDRYEINLIAPDGKVRCIIVRDMPAWPVTETEKEFARERVRNQDLKIAGGQIDAKQIIQQQLDNMTFAETVPRIAALAVDRQDRIWVGVSLTTPGATDRVDLYNRDGAFMGSFTGLQVPGAFLADGRGASLVKDADTDIQRIAVYRIVESTR